MYQLHLEFHAQRCIITSNCWLLLCIDILDGLVDIRNTTNNAIKCVKQKSGLFKICHRKQPKSLVVLVVIIVAFKEKLCLYKINFPKKRQRQSKHLFY